MEIQKSKPITRYYVVWKGRAPGVYDNWTACSEQVKSFRGALYKSFPSPAVAREAFEKGSALFIGKYLHSSQEITERHPAIIKDSICVDGACNTKTGVMECRGVESMTGKELFHVGPLSGGTNNIAEFLASSTHWRIVSKTVWIWLFIRIVTRLSNGSRTKKLLRAAFVRIVMRKFSISSIVQNYGWVMLFTLVNC